MGKREHAIIACAFYALGQLALGEYEVGNGSPVAHKRYTDLMTIVGVISDTHGRLDERAYMALADCDHIIHAGDIGGPDILRELRTLAPVTAVLGNNDFVEYGADVKRFAHPTIGGVKFLVAHYPFDVDVSKPGSRGLAAGDPIPDVCIHGHTHMPRLDYGKKARPAQFILNPGSASWPRGGNPASVARIVITQGSVESICIASLDGEVLLRV